MTAIEAASDAFNGQQQVATSFYGLGGDAALVQHVHIVWDVTLAATITIESCDMPPSEFPTNVAGAAGIWVQENPPTGYTAIGGGVVAIGAGAAAATPFVLVIAGTAASGASINIGNLGSKRLRAKVVCTVAGQLRIRTNGKA